MKSKCILCSELFDTSPATTLDEYCVVCYSSVIDERTALLRATFNKYGHPVQLASAIASGSPVDFDASDPLGFWSVRMLRAMGHLNVNAVRKENG